MDLISKRNAYYIIQGLVLRTLIFLMVYLMFRYAMFKATIILVYIYMRIVLITVINYQEKKLEVS